MNMQKSALITMKQHLKVKTHAIIVSVTATLSLVVLIAKGSWKGWEKVHREDFCLSSSAFLWSLILTILCSKVSCSVDVWKWIHWKIDAKIPCEDWMILQKHPLLIFIFNICLQGHVCSIFEDETLLTLSINLLMHQKHQCLHTLEFNRRILFLLTHE